MVHYRIYTVGEDGHFTGPPQEVECADDKEAVATAMQMKNGLDMEIWDHKRFVVRLTVDQRVTAAAAMWPSASQFSIRVADRIGAALGKRGAFRFGPLVRSCPRLGAALLFSHFASLSSKWKTPTDHPTQGYLR